MAAWSYSVMKDFFTCPRKFHAEKVLKLYPFVESEQMRYGNEVHKVCENFIGKDVPIPEGHKQFAPALKVLKGKPGKKICEKKMALNTEREPTTYFAKDVWTRGAGDLIIINGKKAKVIDYKTGSAKYPDKDQLELMAMFIFAHYPEVDEVDAALIFLAHKVVVKGKYKRSNLEKMWAKWEGKSKQLDAAHAAGNWPPKTNGLCRSWCPVASCEHNGG